MRYFFAALSLGLALAGTTALAKTAPLTPSTTQCTKEGRKTTFTRTVELKSTETGGCRVYLTRNGGTPTVVAHAEHQLQVCTDIREKVLGNLKDAGFSCE